MIYDAIKNLGEQFLYEPEIINIQNWQKYGRFIVIGMGGSNLSTGLVKIWRPDLDILIHRDYGLPPVSDKTLRESLIILSSYSGNTEEVLDAFETTGKRGFARAAISVGEKLLVLTKEAGVPYIQLPNTGIQPRSAVGYSFKALLKLMGEKESVAKLSVFGQKFHPEEYERAGKTLAKKLHGYVPIIYASTPNEAIAQNWRTRFQETGKIPAYYNVFPELNHNEMTGFDIIESTKMLSDKLYFIFLKDSEDHPRIVKRMETTKKLYHDRNLPVEIVELMGESTLHKIFSAISLVDWTAYYTAKNYGTDPEEVPMVETFKKRMG